jgi:hypothetical protein
LVVVLIVDGIFIYVLLGDVCESIGIRGLGMQEGRIHWNGRLFAVL